MMRMDRAGLVENIVFCEFVKNANADSYKCLKNVAIDNHPHRRILENTLQILRTVTNAATNNANVLQTPGK